MFTIWKKLHLHREVLYTQKTHPVRQSHVNFMLIVLLIVQLLTPWCRVLLEKLTGLQLVKKLPAFHGTRRFITALTSVRHLSLSWASPIQSIYPHPTSWRSVLILSTHLCLGLPSAIPILRCTYLVHAACTESEMHTCRILEENVKKGDHLGDLGLGRNTV